jgi:hypothetical protein
MRYKSEVRSDDEYADLPAVARFTVTEEDMTEIRRLAKIVADNGLFKVEKFDYRVQYYLTEGGKKVERTDADTLNVNATEFWFAAYIKHTNTEILTKRYPIK